MCYVSSTFVSGDNGFVEVLGSIARTGRRPAKLVYLLASLGVSFGFIAAVIAIAHASWFRLPAGVVDRDYVTVLRRSETEVVPVSLIDFEQVAALAPEVSWFYVRPTQVEVVDPSGRPRMLDAHIVSDGHFRELGVEAGLGHLVPGEGGTPTVVLSDSAWRGLYGSQEVVGNHLQVNGGPTLPIVGVPPPDFVGVLERHPDIWVQNPPLDLTPGPYDMDESTRQHVDRRWPAVMVFGASPGGRDQGDLLGRLRALLTDYRFEAGPIQVEVSRTPSPDGTYSVSTMMFDFGVSETDRLELVEGLETDPDLRRDVAQKTVWLVGIVALLLAIAFVSLVEFLMAENATREDERRVRIAVGAAPMDVLRAVVAENALLLVAVGGLAWLTFGYAMDVLLRFEPFATYLGEASSGARHAGLAAAGAAGGRVRGLHDLCELVRIATFCGVVAARSIAATGRRSDPDVRRDGESSRRAFARQSLPRRRTAVARFRERRCCGRHRGERRSGAFLGRGRAGVAAVEAIPGIVSAAQASLASLRDLALAGAAVCGLALVIKLAAPAFAAVLALWLVAPALACLVVVCAMMSHLLVARWSGGVPSVP